MYSMSHVLKIDATVKLSPQQFMSKNWYLNYYGFWVKSFDCSIYHSTERKSSIILLTFSGYWSIMR
jgi:hypothetical protein